MDHTTSSSFNGVIALNVKAVVRPDKLDGLLEVLKKDALGSRREEPGCIQFIVGIDENDPNIVHVHEQYKTMEDLDFHNTTPHMAAIVAFVQEDDPLTEPLSIKTYRCDHLPFIYEHNQRQTFCLNVESCIKPELREEYIELMKSHQALSKQEPLCLQFDWGVSTEDPNCFYIHEEYDGRKGFEEHEASEHFAKFTKFNNEKQPYSKPQNVEFFTTIDCE
jgi:quinol monooxygenase YgiN